MTHPTSNWIEKRTDEIFEPMEDDKCESCQINLSVLKIQIKDFLLTALKERDQDWMKCIPEKKDETGLSWEELDETKCFNSAIDQMHDNVKKIK